jgi:hypothetical protein
MCPQPVLSRWHGPLTRCRDLLKRHVTNHDAEPASKRQKREIARDTRVVQACEACSQSHLRCEDEKPCSRCKKKLIVCRVPEVLATDEDDIHEIDAVHAAQDLLDLSNGFDYPSSLSAQRESVNPSATSETPEPLMQPPPLSTNTNRPSVEPSNNRTSMAYLTNMQPPSNNASGYDAMNQNYEDPASSLSFFDNSVSQFDNTPGHNPFLPDYFRNMPPFEAFLSGQATPRGIMDHNFNFDVGLTDLDLGLLDQYSFQVPFAADTPSTDAQGAEQHIAETDGAPIRADALKQSIWRYLPRRTGHTSMAEAVNQAFSESDRDATQRSHITHRRVIAEK